MVDNIVIPSETAKSIEQWLGEWLFGGPMSPDDYSNDPDEIELAVREWLSDLIDTSNTDDQDYILAHIVLEYVENVDIDWQDILYSWIDTEDEDKIE